MKHRTLLAAGTALLAFNIGTALAAGPAAMARSDSPVLLAQADPSQLSPEEMRKKLRREMREQRQEQRQAVPAEQAAPQAPAAEEPRKTKKQLRREERQDLRKEFRENLREETRGKKEPARRAEEPSRPAPEPRPVPEPRKAEKKPVPETPVKTPSRITDTARPAPAEEPVRRTGDPRNADKRDKKPVVTGDQPAAPVKPVTSDAPPVDTSRTPVMVTTPPDLRKPRNERVSDTATPGERRERRAGRREDQRAGHPRIDEPVRPVTEERGERIDPREARTGRRPDEDRVRDRRTFGDRTVLRLGDGRLVVELNAETDSRLRRSYRNVETERLPGGRLRETVARPDGSQVVTIYDRYGDILRRSRILPNGREIVLFYVPHDRWDRIPGWDRDPGYGLPPIVVNVPYDDYIWEPRGASADDYYDFLYQPPVEAAERLYSVDEVRRSARLRQKLPRVDLSTVTFAFGSAEIRDGDVEKLQALAEAMDRILKENPSESFLIEGHTDAVGSDEANLALSDKRAEAVAVALTDVFGLPRKIWSRRAMAKAT
ncbi:MAG: OmpA family protein [Brucellaceae bacterium]|nr:OmpA family protein [Brucellaceae bacterium]